MLRVILIDDEQSVLVGLRCLLDWNAYGFELCGAFQNPQQALDSVRALRPDLVITDIEMPEISGLDLIAALRELSPDSVCVVLSAYDDFGYAQKAVSLGVFRYLLKPLSAESLASLLLDVRQRLAAAAPGAEELSIVRSFVIREILCSGVELSRAGALPYYRALFDGVQLRLLLVCPPDVPEAAEAAEALLRAQLSPYSLFSAGGLCVLLLPDTLSDGAVRRLMTELGWPFRLSEPFSGLPSGHQIYVQLAQSLQNEVFWGGASRRSDPPPDPALLPDAVKNVLLPSVWDPDSTAVSAAFAALLDQLQAGAGTLSKADAVHIYTDILSAANDIFQNICNQKRSRRAEITQLTAQPTLARMHAFALTEVTAALADIRLHLSRSNPTLVGKAKDYIRAHYTDAEFRLSDIADALYVNYSYLSHLFRLETGNTLYSYLLDLRMEQAKLLLTRPELSISEISRSVGYENTKTFYSTFKKAFSESPKNYRQRLLHRR